MSEYTDELENLDFELNIVLKIGVLYYAIKQPDSGLVIDSEKLVVDRPKISGVKLDIRKTSTPIGSLSFILKDEESTDYATTVEIMKTEGMFLEQNVTAYAGFIRGPADPFDFLDYKEISKTKITGIVKVSNGYSVTSKEITHEINKPALNAESGLTTALIPASLSLDIEDGSVAPFTSGIIYVNGEFMNFTGIVGDTITNLVRGIVGSTASDHEVGETVQFVTEFVAQNPIDIMLQIMLSNTGDGSNHATYDVLNGGLNIPTTDIDIVAFENIRDNFFLNEQFELITFGQANILKFIEKELLNATGTRIVPKNGQISLSVLDQVNFADVVPEINEDTIKGNPTWKLSSDKVVNEVQIFYDYNEGTRQYETTKIFKDGDSITTFGLKKPLKLKFKGIKTALDGNAIATERGARLLSRLSTARGEVSFRANFDVSDIKIGDDVFLAHRYIPQEGSTLGIAQQLEVMTRSVDLGKAEVKMNLEFTSYTGIRIPFIGPSPLIVSVTDQKTFEVPDGTCYKIGDCLRLWDDTAVDYLPDANNLVQSISGNIITMLNDFVTPLTVLIRVKLCDYDEASDLQKTRYAYIGENTGFFNDGSKSYQIIF